VYLQLLRYCDDFITIENSEVDCERSLQTMLRVCKLAGFEVQPSKITAPSRIVEFLGIIIDTEAGVLRISQQRLEEVSTELQRWTGVATASKRSMLRLIGRLAFAARVVRYGRAFLARLINFAKAIAHLHYRRRLTPEAKLDISWWRNCIASHNGVYIYTRKWTDGNICHVFTDASDLGIVATCTIDGCLEWFSLAFVGHMKPYSRMSINWREMVAAVMALCTWSHQLSTRMVVFHIDNDAVCNILNKHYTPVPELMTFVREWCYWAELHDVEIAPVYIHTSRNVDADDLSRLRVTEFLGRNPSACRTMTWPSLPGVLNEFSFLLQH
jgi:hypothetical protein